MIDRPDNRQGTDGANRIATAELNRLRGEYLASFNELMVELDMLAAAYFGPASCGPAREEERLRHFYQWLMGPLADSHRLDLARKILGCVGMGTALGPAFRELDRLLKRRNQVAHMIVGPNLLQPGNPPELSPKALHHLGWARSGYSVVLITAKEFEADLTTLDELNVVLSSARHVLACPEQLPLSESDAYAFMLDELARWSSTNGDPTRHLAPPG